MIVKTQVVCHGVVAVVSSTNKMVDNKLVKIIVFSYVKGARLTTINICP